MLVQKIEHNMFDLNWCLQIPFENIFLLTSFYNFDIQTFAFAKGFSYLC